MNRVMFAIPFGVLTAACGAHVLLGSGLVAARAVAVLLLLSVPWQFSGFYSGYMGGYRVASAPWFAGNVREAVRATMRHAEGTAGPIYLSSEIEWIHRTWRFYAIEDARPQMIGRAEYVVLPRIEAAGGSLFLCPATSQLCDRARSMGWRIVETAASIDGSRAFNVLQRRPDTPPPLPVAGR